MQSPAELDEAKLLAEARRAQAQALAKGVRRLFGALARLRPALRAKGAVEV